MGDEKRCTGRVWRRGSVRHRSFPPYCSYVTVEGTACAGESCATVLNLPPRDVPQTGTVLTLNDVMEPRAFTDNFSEFSALISRTIEC